MIRSALLVAVLAGLWATVVDRAQGATRASRLVRRLPAGATSTAATAAAATDGNSPRWFVRRVEAAELPASPEVLWRSWLVAIGLAAALGWSAGGLGLAVVLVAVAGLAPAGVVLSQSGRRDAAYVRGLPEALEAIARGLRSGAALPTAIGEAARGGPARVAADLDGVALATAAGQGLVDALDAWARRRPGPEVRLAVAALALAAEAGGAQARAIDGVAETIRARLAVVDEVRALGSQARLSGLVVGVSPLAFAGFALATDDRTASFLLTTSAGWACLVVGLGLDGIGAWWMQRIARVEM